MKQVDVERVHGNVRSAYPIRNLFEDDELCQRVDDALVQVRYLDDELYEHINSDLFASASFYRAGEAMKSVNLHPPYVLPKPNSSASEEFQVRVTVDIRVGTPVKRVYNAARGAVHDDLFEQV